MRRLIFILVVCVLAASCAKPPYAITSQQLVGPVETIKSTQILMSAENAQAALVRAALQGKMNSLLGASGVRVPMDASQADTTITVSVSEVNLATPTSFVGKFKVVVQKMPNKQVLWQGEFIESSFSSASPYGNVGSELATGIVTRLRELGFVRK